jgi:hypothetical protein
MKKPSLLDIKRKIKTRMMENSLSLSDAPPGHADNALDKEIEEYYNKIFAEKAEEENE